MFSDFVQQLRQKAAEKRMTVWEMLSQAFIDYGYSAVLILLNLGLISESDVEACEQKAEQVHPRIGQIVPDVTSFDHLAESWKLIAELAAKNFQTTTIVRSDDQDRANYAMELLALISQHIAYSRAIASQPEKVEAGEQYFFIFSIGAACEALTRLGEPGYDTFQPKRRQGGLTTGGNAAADADKDWRDDGRNVWARLRVERPEWGATRVAKEIIAKVPGAAKRQPTTIKTTVEAWNREARRQSA
jgi:hypothetical protein